MKPSYAACTIVARNYLAHARVLARSFASEHPDVAFFTLVIDGTESDRTATGVGTVVLPADLDIAPATLHSMMVIYTVMELSTALKPAMLAKVLHSGADAAAYFDPDVRIYASVADVIDTARECGVVLTPHTIDPMPRDGLNLSERAIMQSGIYNLGFIAVGYRALPFLQWWHERLTTDGIVDVENGLFTDQRWVDWVPSLFPHSIVRDRGLNVAYWNVHERPISVIGGGLRAGADPLRFFHFSGYDPAHRWQVSKHMLEPARVTLADLPELRRLCDAYADELVELGHTESRRATYRLDQLANGLALLPRLRRMVRKVVIGAVECATPPPDAIEHPEHFTAWLSSRVIGSGATVLTPAQWSVWDSREDLRRAFPDVLGTDWAAFARWCATDAETRAWLARLRAMAGVAEPAREPRMRRRAFGWSVIAYANSEMGVGEAGRRAARSVAATGVPSELVATRVGTLSRASHEVRSATTTEVGFENVLTCVNADQLSTMVDALDLRRLRGWHAGLWFWELERFPDSFAPAFDLVHEVLVASEFTRRAIQSKTDKPVRLVRLPIDVPTRPTAFTRRTIGFPESTFVFLTNFDYLSVPARKNPAGTIRAYITAFGPDDGATLVVKSINGRHRPGEREALRALAADRPDVVFLDDYVSAAQLKAMLELADCFVSLHRSEGYGLNIADAMAHGTPTIATGYSGNLDFSTQQTSMLVPCDIVEVGDHAAPYDSTAHWADPDMDAASSAMRLLFDDRSAATALADRALAHVREHHSLLRAAESFRPMVLGHGGEES